MRLATSARSSHVPALDPAPPPTRHLSGRSLSTHTYRNQGVAPDTLRMGLLSTPNHQALIRDCYPPHSSSSSSSQGSLPQPVSNALSKLTFYAVNRPAKIPKVVAALVERATKARAGSSTHKSRQDLAVTVEILRALVVECGESGKDGAGELIKGAIAEDALRVAEMALGGEGAKDGLVATTAQIKREKRDPEMEARGASLVRLETGKRDHGLLADKLTLAQFLAFATFLTPPFVGVADGVGRHYLRCLSLLSGLAQLQAPGQAPCVVASHFSGSFELTSPCAGPATSPSKRLTERRDRSFCSRRAAISTRRLVNLCRHSCITASPPTFQSFAKSAS